MKSSTFRLTATAVLIAVMVLLEVAQLGLINLIVINITTLCVVVVAGTLLLGMKSGLILGACFGVISMLNALGVTRPPTTLVAPLLANSPFLTIVMCIVPRLAIPVTTWLAHRLISRSGKYAKIAVPIAAVVGSLTNTVLYLGSMLLFYTLTGIDAQPVLTTIGVIVAGAGIGEAVAAAVVSSGVVAAGRAVLKRRT